MSAGPNSLGPGGQALTRGVLPPPVFDPKLAACDWYVYQLDAGNAKPPSGGGENLAPGDVANVNFLVERGTDFYLTELGAYAMDTAGGDYFVPSDIQATVQMYDSGTVVELSNGAIPVGCLFGNAEGASHMILPRLFRALSTVTCTVTNVSGDITFTHLWLTFIGYKVYRQG